MSTTQLPFLSPPFRSTALFFFSAAISRLTVEIETSSFSFISSVIFSIIFSITAEPWRERFGESDSKIDIPVRQLEFRLGKAAFFAEIKDVGDASAPGFHQSALEEDFADEFVDGLGLWPFVEGFRGGAWRKSARVGEFYPIVEDGDR